MTKSPSGSHVAAILLVAASTALFSFQYATGKLAGNAFSPYQILFLRYVSGFAIVALLVLVNAVPILQTSPRRLGTHAVRAACGSLGGVCTIQATGLMPVVDASAIGLTEGLLTVIMGILFLSEVVTARHWRAIVICGVGAGVVAFGNGAFSGTGAVDRAYLAAAGIAFLGALLIAFESIFIRILSLAERPLSVLFFVNLFGMLIMAGPALAGWSGGLSFSALVFLALGPLAIFAQYLNILAFRRAPVSVLGPVTYSWIIFGGLIGLAFFGEIPTLATVAGSVLIIGGGVLLARVPAGEPSPRDSEAVEPAG